MIIKKFTGETMREAMNKVKESLGSDAIILKSEKVAQGGIFDFSDTKHLYEVTAAVDNTPIPSFEQKKFENMQERNKQSVIKDKKFNKEIFNNEKPQSKDFIEEIEKSFKVMDLKNDLSKIDKKLDHMSNHIKYNEMPNLPDSLVPFYIRLKESGVSERINKDIMMHIYMNFKGDDFLDDSLINDAVYSEIEKRLSVESLEDRSDFAGPQVIAFVGPTGVGKTTTLAKMAFNKTIFGKKKVALITADTYRIAAVEQLKTYSKITNIPLEVIYKPEQIRSALIKFDSYDYILIDTAGRSQKNVEQMAELKKIMYEGKVQDICLVLSANTRDRDLDDIIKRFSSVGYNRIIYTKLDETTTYGSLLNIYEQCKIPLSYITYGQNVPEDIREVDGRDVSNFILYPEKIKM
ncbi:MAG: flagellar biosynthesis protein FlhF [Candidatus Cloacimonadota bacterium]|nr:MAG: flagellar biosynthesis protein FlhF [Candidatus Cloacimonadota bacterium]PIE78396.1 MAG: flagellar biosynthesis protein FlhF [Candidatus Delongbacteria bacterium]